MGSDIVGWDLIFSKVWGIDFSKGSPNIGAGYEQKHKKPNKATIIFVINKWT
jgi:hypothetical protein